MGGVCLESKDEVSMNTDMERTQGNEKVHTLLGTGRLNYDTEAKQFFSYKEVLCHIIKEVVPEFRDKDLAYVAQCIGNVETDAVVEMNSSSGVIGALNNESNPIDEKKIFYDIKTTLKAEDNEEIDFILNFEMQNNSTNYKIESRGVYYCSRLISEQLKSLRDESCYSRLRKVYSIWVVRGNSEDVINDYALADKCNDNAYEHDANLIELIIIRITDQSKEVVKNKLFDFLHIILDSMDTETRRNKIGKYIDFSQAIENIERSFESMCTLGQSYINEGLKKGIEKGIEEGVASANLKVVKNLLSKGYKDEEIMDIVSITESELKEYKNILKKKEEN